MESKHENMKKLTLAFFTIYLFSNVSLSIGANHSDADYYKVTVSKTLGEAPTLLATENGTQSLIKQFYIRLDTEWNSSWIRIVASLLIFSLSVLPYFLPLFFIFRKLPNKSGSFVNFISRLLVWFWHCIGFVLAIISSGRFSELLSIPAGILVVATGIILRKIRFNRKKTLWRKNNPELAKKEDEQIRRAEKQVEEEQKRKTEVDLLEEQIRYYYAHLRNFCQQNEQFNKAWTKMDTANHHQLQTFPTQVIFNS